LVKRLEKKGEKIVFKEGKAKKGLQKGSQKNGVFIRRVYDTGFHQKGYWKQVH